MNPSDAQVTSLLVALHPVKVAALLVDHICTHTQTLGDLDLGADHSMPVTGCLRDGEALRLLLSPEAQCSGASTDLQDLYAKSFVLRHAATWIALAARLSALPDDLRQSYAQGNDLSSQSPYGSGGFWPLVQELMTSVEEGLFKVTRHGNPQDTPWGKWDTSSTLPGLSLRLALSARGLEWALAPKSSCSHFDPYLPQPCTNRALADGLACHEHTVLDWLAPPNAQKPSADAAALRQSSTLRLAKLFAYYRDIRNLGAYSEHDLQRMIQDFWRTFGQTSWYNTSHGTAGQRGQGLLSMEQAALELGYSTASEALGLGTRELARRFKSRARQAHPDMGGCPKDFQVLNDAYRVLQGACTTPPTERSA